MERSQKRHLLREHDVRSVVHIAHRNQRPVRRSANYSFTLRELLLLRAGMT